MFLKVLIVEDVDELYEYYLQIFEHELPVEEIEFTRASSIQAAVELLPEPWDVILMDYGLGETVVLDKMKFKNGRDLVAFRRALEVSRGDVSRCYILGISSNGVGNDLMVESGANHGLLKLLIPEMADVLKVLLAGKKGRNV